VVETDGRRDTQTDDNLCRPLANDIDFIDSFGGRLRGHFYWCIDALQHYPFCEPRTQLQLPGYPNSVLTLKQVKEKRQ